MNKLIITLTILNVMIAPVIAQELQGCYLIDENGKVQYLDELCPSSEKPIAEEKKDNSPPVSEENTTPKMPTFEENKTDQTESKGAFFTVPIKKRVGGIPLIDVTFNGKNTFEMLLDTGATVTTITEKMGTELKLQLEQTVPVITAGGTIQSGLTKVESIKAGDLEVKNLLVSLSSNIPFGLLGQNFYSDYDLSIKENVIEFAPRKPK